MGSHTYTTQQEAHWAGGFGDDYVERNRDAVRISRRIAQFAKIIEHTSGLGSVLELGANVGHNLLAIGRLLPLCRLSGLEINAKALDILRTAQEISVFPGSILDFSPEQLGTHDMVFTSGVLIHINPDALVRAYELLYRCSRRYVLVNEYYNPSPVALDYRGHEQLLFKRDFAGEIMDRYPDLELVGYGFQYHRDNNFSADDSTWLLMRKRA